MKITFKKTDQRNMSAYVDEKFAGHFSRHWHKPDAWNKESFYIWVGYVNHVYLTGTSQANLKEKIERAVNGEKQRGA